MPWRKDGLPSEFQLWRGREYGNLHINIQQCLKAFMENPVGIGGLKDVVDSERPLTWSYNRAQRSGRRMCKWCLIRYQMQNVMPTKTTRTRERERMEESLADHGFVVVR